MVLVPTVAHKLYLHKVLLNSLKGSNVFFCYFIYYQSWYGLELTITDVTAKKNTLKSVCSVKIQF